MDEHSSQHIGVYQGAFSCPAAVQSVVEHSDCILFLGGNLTDWTTGSFSGHISAACIVDVKLNSTCVAGGTFEGVRSRDLVAALAGALRKRSADGAAYWTRRSATDGVLHLQDFLPGAPLTMDAILAGVQAELRAGDILVADTCTAGFGLASMRLPSGTRVLNQMLYGSIGFATPAAGGAALALAREPAQRVFCLTGDGCLQVRQAILLSCHPPTDALRGSHRVRLDRVVEVAGREHETPAAGDRKETLGGRGGQPVRGRGR